GDPVRDGRVRLRHRAAELVVAVAGREAGRVGVGHHGLGGDAPEPIVGESGHQTCRVGDLRDVAVGEVADGFACPARAGDGGGQVDLGGAVGVAADGVGPGVAVGVGEVDGGEGVPAGADPDPGAEGVGAGGVPDDGGAVRLAADQIRAAVVVEVGEAHPGEGV